MIITMHDRVLLLLFLLVACIAFTPHCLVTLLRRHSASRSLKLMIGNEKWKKSSTPVRKNVSPKSNQESRQLSKAEKKAKEVYEEMKGPRVERICGVDERVPLTDLETGQRKKGRVISMTE